MSKKKRMSNQIKSPAPSGQIVPLESPNKGFIGRLKGIIKIIGDIESPVVPPEAWEYD